MERLHRLNFLVLRSEGHETSEGARRGLLTTDPAGHRRRTFLRQHHVLLRAVLQLSSRIILRLVTGYFPSGSPIRNLHAFLVSPIPASRLTNHSLRDFTAITILADMRAYKPHSPRYAVTRVTPDTHFNDVALSFQTLRLTFFTKVRLGAEVPGCRQQQSTLLWTALRRCSVSGNQTE